MKLSSEHKCQHCGSHEIRSVESANVYHVDKDTCIEEDYQYSIDDEEQMDLICDNCNMEYSINFDIVERIPRGEDELIEYLESRLKELKLKKSLKKFVE